MEFDSKGNLAPYEGIETDLLNFEEVFVSSFSQSTTRKKLFDNYLQLIGNLPREVVSNGRQWIDGSYVTRKMNPTDLDVVIFINHQLFEQYQLLHIDTRRIKTEKGLDIYFVQSYPVEHPYYFRTQFDENEWQTLFCYNRQFQPKGFIKLLSYEY